VTPARIEAPLVAYDGVRLFRQWWVPEGAASRVVVLLHGAGEHGGRYPDLVGALTDHGAAVCAPDLRGHGRSEGDRGHVDRFSDYLRDLELVLETVASPTGPLGQRVRGLPVHLLGYSLGGLIAATVALRRQSSLASLIGVAPALGRGARMSRPQLAAARAFGLLAPRLPLVRLDPAEMMRDPAAVRAYRADPLIYHGRFDARLLAEFAHAIARLQHQVDQLRLPLLVLHGRDDLTASPHASQLLVDRAGSADKRLLLYDGVRHSLLHEAGRDRAHADITAWLDRHALDRHAKEHRP
jgi:acylglycerol lipase